MDPRQSKTALAAAAAGAAAGAVAACVYCAASTGDDEASRLAGPASEIRTWDAAVTDYCLDRIVTTNDGGTATLDSQPAAGVRIETVAAAADGPFTPWVRDGELSGDPDGAGPRGSADWYVPPGATPRARMLFLHGGGYTWYAPQDPVYRSFGTRLAETTGMAVLAIDYRLAPEAPHPACIEDADKALRWLAKNGAINAFCRHFHTETINLPRKAWDKHTGKVEEQRRFVQARMDPTTPVLPPLPPLLRCSSLSLGTPRAAVSPRHSPCARAILSGWTAPLSRALC
jgi:hypothetical protein